MSSKKIVIINCVIKTCCTYTVRVERKEKKEIEKKNRWINTKKHWRQLYTNVRRTCTGYQSYRIHDPIKSQWRRRRRRIRDMQHQQMDIGKTRMFLFFDCRNILSMTRVHHWTNIRMFVLCLWHYTVCMRQKGTNGIRQKGTFLFVLLLCTHWQFERTFISIFMCFTNDVHINALYLR